MQNRMWAIIVMLIVISIINITIISGYIMVVVLIVTHQYTGITCSACTASVTSLAVNDHRFNGAGGTIFPNLAKTP